MKKYRAMKKMFEKLKLDFNALNEKQFLKEYVFVMKPVCEYLKILEADKKIGMGYLLPSLTLKLASLKYDTTIPL
jgi:hypothetical protein